MGSLSAIELLPLGRRLLAESGASLLDVLFVEEVEFPCGGRGRCRGCKIRVLGGFLPVTEEDRRLLDPAQVAAGWRLACCARVEGDLRIELAQWETAILADDTAVSFTPRDGLGAAVDLGTTTLVAQLLDLRTGRVLATRTALNPQARHGADIMSRVEFATAGGGAARLTRLIRERIGGLLAELFLAGGQDLADLRDVVVVGNTVMHHLFCALDPAPLAQHPFEPAAGGLQVFTGAQLGWAGAEQAVAHFLPCLGGFVGSDILAGVLATGLHERELPAALIDLGTNGEIVVGNRERLLCASTAAGPAFEGARISMGMRAAPGAISAVDVRDGRLHSRVLGNAPPRGLCGSGLVDAVAAGLITNRILPCGRLADGEPLVIDPPVTLTQSDVRELQLAKGAIAAGLRLLTRQWGLAPDDLQQVYLAGAFGNYINRTSARRIGLIPVPLDKVKPVGNTALLGAKLALAKLSCQDGAFPAVRQRIRHSALNVDPAFQEVYLQEMGFPEGLAG